jgi:hypothetical protein
LAIVAEHGNVSAYAQNHTLLVVRSSGRRGDELLRLDFQEFENPEREPGGWKSHVSVTFELEGQRA